MSDIRTGLYSDIAEALGSTESEILWAIDYLSEYAYESGDVPDQKEIIDYIERLNKALVLLKSTPQALRKHYDEATLPLLWR